jgi:hypothetical protein
MDPIESDIQRIQPYSRSDVDAILARFAGLLRGCIVIRVDRFSAAPIGADNPLRLVYDHPKGTGYLSAFPSGEVQGGATLTRMLGLSPRDISEVVCLLHDLGSLNSFGAWCLTESPVPDFVVTLKSADGEPIASDSYLAETCSILGEELTLCDRILIQYHVMEAKGPSRPQRRRAFLRFLAQDGSELAALDGAGMALHARQQILKRDANQNILALNMARMRYWARQLGTNADHLAETFPTLSFFTSSLHVTELRLRTE